jgi:hypothetical protein
VILHSAKEQTQEAVETMKPAHYKAKLDRYNYYHVVEFDCPGCGRKIFGRLHGIVGKTLSCHYCNESFPAPPIPCVDNSCDGVFERCGGQLEYIDTGSMASGPGTDTRCTKCGGEFIGERSGPCDNLFCNKCGKADTDFKTHDLPTLPD